MTALLTAYECYHLVRYPRGRSLGLARAGKLPCVQLFDGEVRFKLQAIERLMRDAKRQFTSTPTGGIDG